MNKDSFITFKCPVCKKEITVIRPEDLPTRPFCSKKCRLVDLYRWLNEEYYISEIILKIDECEDN